MKKIKPDLFALGILIIFFIIYFHKQIFGEVFYCCDNLLMQVPAKLFLIDHLKAGEFPLWNPYILSGTPYLADINLSPLYPFNILYLFSGVFQALTNTILSHYLLGLTGMYFLARLLGVTRFGAIISAVIFIFSGTTVSYSNNLPMIQTVGLLPILVFFWVRYFKMTNLTTYLPLVLVQSLFFLSGSVQLAYYGMIFIFSYVLILTSGKFTDKLNKIVKVLLLVFLLTSIQLLPFLELSMKSTRLNLGYGYATSGSLNPLWIIRLLVPSVTGDLRNGTVWAQDGSVYGYLGVIGLVLSVFGFIKKRQQIFLGIWAVLALILSFGKYTPLYLVFYYLAPFWGKFRVPSHMLLIYSLAIALLAGFGMDRMIIDKVKIQINYLKKIALLIFIPGLGIYFSQNYLVDTIIDLGNLYSAKLNTKIQFLSNYGITVILKQVASNLFITGVGILGIFIILKNSKLSARTKYLITGVIIFIEISLFSQSALQSVPESKISDWMKLSRQTVKKLDKSQTGNSRILTSSQAYQAPRIKKFGLENHLDETAWQFQILRPNLPMIYGLFTADGYSSVIYRPYSEFISPNYPDPTGVAIDAKDPELLGRLSISQLINKNPRMPGSSLALNSDYVSINQTESEDKFSFISNSGIEPDVKINLQKIQANNAAVEFNTTTDGRLIYRDTYFPGWQAKINGLETKITPYQKIYKAVEVNSGTNLVEFYFLPESFQIGAVTSLLGAVIYLMLIIILIKKKQSIEH